MVAFPGVQKPGFQYPGQWRNIIRRPTYGTQLLFLYTFAHRRNSYTFIQFGVC